MSGPDDVETMLRAGSGQAEAPATFAIAFVEGPHAGKTFTLEGTEPKVLVGQSPVCSLRLTDPEVSRRHLAIECVGARLRLTDLGSTNGTLVNGVAILESWLRGGEVVRLGRSAFRVDVLEPGNAAPLSAATSFGAVVGTSVEMRRLYPLCERIAKSDVPLVIEGETGTGKEVLAEAIHDASPAASGPFVVFDCTAVPPGLVESELFGHERGAFTGAVNQRKGVFEQAHGGTLLIDEIGDLPAELQAKLLRALERSEVRRVGGDRWIKVDVRVIAATRRDLDREVQDGRFRDDLFFRLAVARIELPPLRRRRGDVGVLAAHFWKELGGPGGTIPYELLQRIEQHSWPGNVRELRNFIARNIALGDLGAGEMSTPSTPATDTDLYELPFPLARQRALAEFERTYMERAVARHGGNITHAAKASGIARRYFGIILARRR